MTDRDLRQEIKFNRVFLSGILFLYTGELLDKDNTKNDKGDNENKFEILGSLIAGFCQSGSQIDGTSVTRILTSGSHSKIIISGSIAFKAQKYFIDPLAIKTMNVWVTFSPLISQELPQKYISKSNLGLLCPIFQKAIN